MARFGAVVTAMVTPFAEDGSLDVDAAVRLARWLVDQGNDGLVVAGTTGEGPVLTDVEKVELWKALADAVTVPIVAGTGTNSTEHSILLTKAAAQCGVAGALVVCPYYNRPSQAGIEAHLRAVAESSDLPVLIYDIPVRTGRKVSNEVMVRLAREVPQVVGVKDAAGDVPASARLIAEAPEDFELYSGDDAATLALLAVGAVGVIGVETHWAAPQMGEMIASFAKGDVVRARQLNQQLMPSHAFQTGDVAPNPVPAKAMMRVLGHAVGQCRLPMGPAPDGLEERAREVLVGLGDGSAGSAGVPVRG